MTAQFFLEDRLLALKYVFGEVPLEPFNMRDDRQCAYRVLSNLIAREQVCAEVERDEKKALLQILGAYRALPVAAAPASDLFAAIDTVCEAGEAAAYDEVLRLVRRCLIEVRGDSAEASLLHRRSAQAHLGRIAAIETRYRKLIAETPPTLTAAEPVVDFDALGRCLSERRSGPEAIIRPIRVVNGGYSKITILCSLTTPGQSPANVVVRSDAGLGFADTSVLDEFPIIEAMYHAGVAAPRPLWAGRTSDGALPALVVEHVEGEPFGSPFVAPVRNEALCRDMGRHLARIHRAPLASLGMLRDSAVATPDQVNRAIQLSRGHLHETGDPAPVVEFAFRWLADNVHMSVGKRTALHGDYGPHNLLARGDRVTAILDWEFAKIGNPAEDLSYSRLGIETLGSWDMFLQAYVEAGGVRPSENELHYFTVLGLTRLCVMVMQTDAAFHGSRTKAIRMATPGAERLRPALLRLGRLLSL